MDERSLGFNGVNGATGGYLFPTLTPRQLADLIQTQSAPQAVRPKALRRGVDPEDVASCGWGAVFAEDADPAVEEALRPLLEHRREQATSENERFFHHMAGSTHGYWQGESKAAFLARRGAGPGPVDPEKMPYYLLIVGGPEEIPFHFQHQLGVQYAVGRVAFDTLEKYHRYACNVVAAETGTPSLTRHAGFFGVRNPDDPATRHSSQYLIEPLIENLSKRPDWKIEAHLGEAATKDRLSALLGEVKPSLLFTTSHGMGFPRDDARQRRHSGALLCQDWPGPEAWKRGIPESHYFSGQDVGSDADLRSRVTFHFACFGAGVPERDTFGHGSAAAPEVLAPEPFVAALPQRLLELERGALAVIGHVDRAWGFSFYWPRAGRQPATFEAALKALMDGEPVGRAMRYFGERYGQLAADLTTALELARAGQPLDPQELTDLWTANNDSRSYAILGDPAVRLRFPEA